LKITDFDLIKEFNCVLMKEQNQVHNQAVLVKPSGHYMLDVCPLDFKGQYYSSIRTSAPNRTPVVSIVVVGEIQALGFRFRSAAGFALPENALKRADELENVGQKLSALQQLHDVVTSKKHRTWSKTYEDITSQLIDLCVEMKVREIYAKEALMQYRDRCQQAQYQISL